MTAQPDQTTLSTEPSDDETALSQEVQELEEESRATNTFAQGIGAFFLYKLNKKSYIAWAHKTLKQENIVENLLDVKNPEKRLEIKRALKYSEALGKEKGKRHVSTDESRRIKYAAAAAGWVSRRINNTENSLRIQSIIIRYGLNEESAQKLQEAISEWIAQNPQASINDHLYLEGEKLHLAQEGLVAEDEIKDKKSLTKAVKKQSQQKQEELVRAREFIREDFKTVGDKAIELEKRKIQRAKEVCSRILNPESPEPTVKQIYQELIAEEPVQAQIDEGVKISTVSTGEQVPKSSVDFEPEEGLKEVYEKDIIKPEESTRRVKMQKREGEEPAVLKVIQSDTTTPGRIKKEPVSKPRDSAQKPSTLQVSKPPLPKFIPSIIQKHTMRTRAFFIKIGQKTRVLRSLLPPLRSITHRFKMATNTIFRGGSNIIKKVVKTGISKIGRSLVVKSIGGALSGGILTALSVGSDIIRALTGIDLEGMLLKGIIVVTITAVSIPFLLLILGFVGLSRIIPNYGVKNAMEASTSKQTSVSWNRFEKEYLSLEKNKKNRSGGWFVFKNNFLSLKKDR